MCGAYAQRLYSIMVHIHTSFMTIWSSWTIPTMQDAPFFTVKLNIKVLPCVLMFSTGVAVDRVAGFDDYGAKDDFTTDAGRSPTRATLCCLHELFLLMTMQAL